MMLKNAPVAVLDSGIGGIGVLRELQKELPQERFLFFGDAANAPYGEKSTEEIRQIVLARAKRLLCRAKALVLACNTATAAAADLLRRQYDLPIIGMEPALRPALRCGAHPKVLVLATAATLREKKWHTLVRGAEREAEIFSLAAPGLVRFAEAGVFEGAKVSAYLRELLAPYRGICFDGVVLGCTHFPFLRRELERAFPYPVPLFDGAKGTAAETARQLRERDLLCTDDTAAPLLAPHVKDPVLQMCAGERPEHTLPHGGTCCKATCAQCAGTIAPPAYTCWHCGKILLSASKAETVPLMRRLLYYVP